MQKAKALRLAGFVGALCTSAALIGVSVAGTGAYFSDSHNGAINASTGHIRVSVSPSNGELNFTDLLPGNYKTQRVIYTADTKGGNEDVWLVFPDDGTAQAIVGTADVNGGGLGQYGHFAVASTGGAHFTSYNLNKPGTTDGHTGTPCWRDANGWGGSTAQETYPSGPAVPYCAPSNAILLQSNLANGKTGHADLTFGYTPKLRGAASEDLPLTTLAKYQIVATQHGVNPLDPSNTTP